jgi:hypothetical protein
MRYLVFLFLILFCPCFAKDEAKKTITQEDFRKIYVDELIAAFHMQANTCSNANSYSACVQFNCARDKLLAMGESPEKLALVGNLWQWYRTYGYNSGLILNPVLCPGEYISNKSYVCTKPLDPKQKQAMGNFLLGVGSVVSGIFCIAVNAPLLSAKVGFGLVTFGLERIWDSVSNMLVDYGEKQARQHELEEMERKIEAVLKK